MILVSIHFRNSEEELNPPLSEKAMLDLFFSLHILNRLSALSPSRESQHSSIDMNSRRKRV